MHKHTCLNCSAVIAEGDFDCERDEDHDFELCTQCAKTAAQEQAYREFVNGFKDGAELTDRADADSHWAAYSRSLTNAERKAEEDQGYQRGFDLGVEYLTEA